MLAWLTLKIKKGGVDYAVLAWLTLKIEKGGVLIVLLPTDV